MRLLKGAPNYADDSRRHTKIDLIHLELESSFAIELYQLFSAFLIDLLRNQQPTDKSKVYEIWITTFEKEKQGWTNSRPVTLFVSH